MFQLFHVGSIVRFVFGIPYLPNRKNYKTEKLYVQMTNAACIFLPNVMTIGLLNRRVIHKCSVLQRVFGRSMWILYTKFLKPEDIQS